MNTNMTDIANKEKYAPKGIPLEKILELKAKKLTQNEIAKVLGCARSNISQRLSEIEGLPEWKRSRADILALKQREILQYMTPNKLKDAQLGSLSLAFCQLYDKERIETGKSTQNVAYLNVNPELAEVRAKLKALGEEE